MIICDNKSLKAFSIETLFLLFYVCFCSAVLKKKNFKNKKEKRPAGKEIQTIMSAKVS
jgi:hypothetical protein